MDAAALDAVRIEFGPASQAGLSVILGLMMFAVGLSLRLEHFAFLRTEPLRVATASLVQLVGLPLVTLGLIHLINPSPGVALGMIVAACCPGGAVSNLLTHLARGRTALSVALTGVSSVAATIATPASILFWSGVYAPTAGLLESLNFQPLDFLLRTALLLGGPLAAGMAIAARSELWAKRLKPPATLLAVGSLATLILIGLASNWELTVSAGGLILAPVALHNAVALALGGLTGAALGMAADGRRALTMEIGLKNTGLGLILLLGPFGGVGAAVAIVAVYGIWDLITGGLLAGSWRVLDRRDDAAGVKTGATREETP